MLSPKVRREGSRTRELLTSFTESPDSEVRGRRNPISIWIYGDRRRESGGL